MSRLIEKHLDAVTAYFTAIYDGQVENSDKYEGTYDQIKGGGERAMRLCVQKFALLATQDADRAAKYYRTVQTHFTEVERAIMMQHFLNLSNSYALVDR